MEIDAAAKVNPSGQTYASPEYDNEATEHPTRFRPTDNARPDTGKEVPDEQE